MIPARAVLLAPILLAPILLPLPAAAQQTPNPASVPSASTALGAGIPEALRGAWFNGASCEAAESMLVLTARGALSLPAGGPPALHRFARITLATGGWTLGTAAGPDAPRLALRSPGPDRLEVAEPAAKTRDDRLPGPGATLRQWRRCPTMPATAAQQAETIAALLVVEQAEASCGPGAPIADCLAGILARVDLTGDGMLSVAELARFGRGAAGLAALQGGATLPPGAPEAALAAARRLVDALDYDGDGRLSAAEMVPDRGALGASPAGTGGPLAALPAMPGMDVLKGMLSHPPP